MVRVTFSLPEGIWAHRIMPVGGFNDRNLQPHPLGRTRAGALVITVDLEPRRVCRFRYLQGGDQWIHDQAGDAHVHSVHGSDDLVLITDADYKRYAAGPSRKNGRAPTTM